LHDGWRREEIQDLGVGQLDHIGYDLLDLRRTSGCQVASFFSNFSAI
jgi:hypothetical protein